MTNNPSQTKVLSTFGLMTMAIVAIVSLHGAPLMASYGLSSVFFYGIGALFFLVPSGLVCAELATHTSAAGGVFAWVRHAFGDKTSFLAIWLEWLNNVISYPTSLSFIVVTIASLFDKHFIEHKLMIFIATLFILWSITWFSTLGIKSSNHLNKLGAIFGILIPAIIICTLGTIWIISGKPLQIEMTWSKLVPDFHQINIAFFAGTLLGYAGIQVIAFHSQNVKKPKHDYPRAILFAMLIIFLVTVLTSLAIAIVVPHNELSLVTGLIDGFSSFFNAFHLSWAIPIITLFILSSSFAALSTWFLGPARGLAVAAQHGFLPATLARVNKHQAPTHILILQAVIASILSAVFLYMPDINSGFWVLLNLSSQSTLIMYMLIFASAIKRRYLKTTGTSLDHAYKIPGGNVMMWIVSGAGILTCVVALVASFIPPNIFSIKHIWRYEFTIVLSNMIFLSIPFGIYYLNNKKMRTYAENAA